jgi:hypothetical protein
MRIFLLFFSSYTGCWYDYRYSSDACFSHAIRQYSPCQFAYRIVHVCKNNSAIPKKRIDFSFTIDNVQEQAKFIWAYDRCALIRDYYARPALFPPFTFLVSLVDICRWCWEKCRQRCCWEKCRQSNKDERCFSISHRILNSSTVCLFSEMIPLYSSVDDAWSEFERYSTNDYVRRLLDAQAANASNTITTDIDRSDVSPTNDNELKRRKLELDHLNEGLTRMRIENSDKFFSMELTATNLNNRVEQIDNRLDKVCIHLIH